LSFVADVVYVRAATDSEAAASLLDLSKGDPTAATMSNMPGISRNLPYITFCSGSPVAEELDVQVMNDFSWLCLD